MIGCLLLFFSWSFPTLLLAFSFAGEHAGDDDHDGNGDHDGDHAVDFAVDVECAVDIDGVLKLMYCPGLTTGMPLLPSYSLLSEVFTIKENNQSFLCQNLN